MTKRIVVAGCRDYTNYDEAKEFIYHCINDFQLDGTLVFLSGKCRGADRLGERFAKENGWTVEYYPAEWKNTEKRQARYGTRKWSMRVISSFAFGTGKAKEPVR